MNKQRHWTDEDLLFRLYGAEPSVDLSLSHFEECPQCAARWASLVSSRSSLLAAAASVPCAAERMRAQRAAVWSRVERPPRRGLRALPAAATVCVLLLAVALQRPAPQPLPQRAAVAVSDEQLFSEIASVVNADEPRAVEPIRGLFHESAALEVQ